MMICAKLGMDFVAATPAGYEPSPAAIEAARAAGGEPVLLEDPREAAAGADVLYTDTWTSMGQEAERDQRTLDLAGHRIDAEMLRLAERDAIVLHCLPAHVGDEITEDVLYGPQCAAWDEAENRLHSEKALLALIVE
jgi:ornithine carbamoyltransferase